MSLSAETKKKINKALATPAGHYSWRDYCQSMKKPDNSCVWCAAGGCKGTKTTVVHNTGLTFTGYEAWVQSQNSAKQQAKNANAVARAPAPVAVLASVAVPVAVPVAAPVAAPARVGHQFHNLNEVADFQSLPPGLKKVVSEDIVSRLPPNVQQNMAVIGDIVGFTDADWPVVQQVAAVALAYAKSIKAAHRPHAPPSHPKGGKRGGRR